MDDATIALVRLALEEDIGTGDATTAATVDPEARATARITQKAPGIVFGLDVTEAVFGELDAAVVFTREVAEGVWRQGGPVALIEGSAAGILTAERTALNFLGHLSGVATLTARCVAEVQSTDTRILDTRKTTPGMRGLEKAAVAAGGGVNHRTGLHDAFLLKENHIALAGGIARAVELARGADPRLVLTVECRDLAEVDEALAARAPRILLDNMAPDLLRTAVARIDRRAETEASGGIELGRLGAHAATGVEFISIGALTHSAPGLDLSLTLEPIR